MGMICFLNFHKKLFDAHNCEIALESWESWMGPPKKFLWDMVDMTVATEVRGRKWLDNCIHRGVSFVPWWFTREVVGALLCFTLYQILQSLFSLSKLLFAFAHYLVVSQFNESSSPKSTLPDLGWVLCSRLALYN